MEQQLLEIPFKNKELDLKYFYYYPKIPYLLFQNGMRQQSKIKQGIQLEKITKI